MAEREGLPNPRGADVFLDAAKETPLAALAQESAIVASLALQSGCPLGTLRHALAGRAIGALGEALALIEVGPMSARSKASKSKGEADDLRL
jgi:hypothetical protein